MKVDAGVTRLWIAQTTGLWGGKLSPGRRSWEQGIPQPLLIQQLPQPGAKCRQASGTFPTGSRTGGIPSATGPFMAAMSMDKGENANPTGMVQRIGY